MPKNVKTVIIDATELVEDLSAILSTHDDSGDLDPDHFVKLCSVAAALGFNQCKVDDHRLEGNPSELFSEALVRVHDELKEYIKNEDGMEKCKTAVALFVKELTEQLILGIEDHSYIPVFSSIRADLSITFNMCFNDGAKNENDTSSDSGDQ